MKYWHYILAGSAAAVAFILFWENRKPTMQKRSTWKAFEDDDTGKLFGIRDLKEEK